MAIEDALASYDLPTIRHFQKHTARPDLSHIPGDRGWPFLGHTWYFLNDLHGLLNRQFKKYGSVFRFKNPMGELVFLLGPDANKLVYQNEGKLFSNFLAWDNTFYGLFDNNLLERDFANHKYHRKILQLAFKRPAIEGHMALMNPLMRQAIGAWPTGRSIKTMDKVKKLLLDVGANVFLGLQIGDEADRLNRAFVDIVAATADPFHKKSLFFMPYAKGIKGRQVLSNFIFDNIASRRRQQSRDIFSQICHLTDENGETFSDEEVRDHITFLLFAAHDTTTSALSAILFALATHQDWQEELRQEIFSLGKEEIEFDDIDKMVKTGWTFQEALRMYPALCMMPRYALKDFEFQGHLIPANAAVGISPLFTHYMEDCWTNPYQFDPTRFSAERAEDKRDFYQYVPFGGGAHKCLGLHFAQVQGKMFLFHLLKNYRVTKNPKMVAYKYNNIPLTFPTDGLPLTMHAL